ncbi:hypothetical protein DL768_009508 [Monosporascus sp. mg162]|nr:hypothetical protein DL768_009508 [Monosporascus sp. mg162]
MLIRNRESRYSAHRCLKIVQQLDVSQFYCSTPTWTSYTYDDDETVVFDPCDPQTVFPGRRGFSTNDSSAGVTEGRRRDRSGAAPLESLVSASTARRKSISRVSKPAASDRRHTKRRGRGNHAAEEMAYFFDKFSNLLHPLHVGSSLAEETISEWTSRTTHKSRAPFQRSLIEPVADGAGESTMLLDWYNDASWTERPPSNMPGIKEESVNDRVRFLGNLMQNWDEVEPAVEQAEEAAEASGSPLTGPVSYGPLLGPSDIASSAGLPPCPSHAGIESDGEHHGLASEPAWDQSQAPEALESPYAVDGPYLALESRSYKRLLSNLARRRGALPAHYQLTNPTRDRLFAGFPSQHLVEGAGWQGMKLSEGTAIRAQI